MAFPDLGPNVARRNNPRMMRCARWVLGKLGWSTEGMLPNHKKFVVIAAYHTSNWDFLVAMTFIFALGVQISWIAKHTIFRWPFRALLRALGGKPVNRKHHQGLVQRAVDLFEEHEKFVLAITPEGTRSRVGHWKTGFYHIATGAEVGILPVYFDYPGRKVGIGSLFTPTGNREKDMAALHRFYQPYKATAARPDRA